MNARIPFVILVLGQRTEDHSKVTQDTKSEKEEGEFSAKITRKKSKFTATNVRKMSVCFVFIEIIKDTALSH